MFDKIRMLTFDCYGTLIDWESGILAALRPICRNHGLVLDQQTMLEQYAGLEAGLESGSYKLYRTILEEVVDGFGKMNGFVPSQSERKSLAESIRNWSPFPDTVDSLKRLQQRFGLSIISNIDDDLFAFSAARLEVKFDHVITAEQVGTYKPFFNNFRFALHKIGLHSSSILHIAQSLYHDIAPAKEAGLQTVWVNRRSGKSGSGAAPAASARPDWTVDSLDELVNLLLENE